MTRLMTVKTREVNDAENADQGQVQRQPEPESIGQQFATEMLLEAVRALSARTVVALANLFTLLTVASAFYLWVVALPNINTLQIVGLTIYSAFILLVNIWGRRK